MITVLLGAHGFLGQYVYEELIRVGFDGNDIICPLREEYDLRNLSACRSVVRGADTVINLAANVGGIGYNRKYPGDIFYDNAILGIQVMEEARKAGVKKFVQIGTICSYPKFTPLPFKEGDLWNGYPEETNAAYGLAKKILLVQAQAYRQQYGFNAIYLLPVNLYGPGDNFDLENSHVIPAMIRKFVEAKKNNLPTVEVWGTGSATREFLYVGDCARAIVMATKGYDGGEPVNIGSGNEISIKDLIQKIKEIVGYTGEIVWNSSYPDGQPKRMLDISRARKEFGFEAQIDFDTGLRNTIKWYLQQI